MDEEVENLEDVAEAPRLTPEFRWKVDVEAKKSLAAQIGILYAAERGSSRSGVHLPWRRDSEDQDAMFDEHSDNEDYSDDEEMIAPATDFRTCASSSLSSSSEALPPFETEKHIALPEKSPSDPRVTLVLDLDETLVHCFAEPVSADARFMITWEEVEYEMYLRKRPHVEIFLEQVSQWFEVVAFTASHSDYGTKVLNAVDPEGKYIKYRRFRDSCTFSGGNYLKDLFLLERDRKSICIVDNSPVAYSLQPENGIPISGWYGTDDTDTELLRLLPFLRQLSKSCDVPSTIKAWASRNPTVDCA